MEKIFVVSDIWFNRPYGQYSDMSSDEYNKMIIESWNSVVNEGDVVFVLGGLGISELYPYFIKLNGEIHILNNAYTTDEISFLGFLQNNVNGSSNELIKSKFNFEHEQIVALIDEDVMLSYYPLADWGGKDTGTMQIHGFNEIHNFKENSFTCMLSANEFKPLLISELKETIEKIKKNLSK